MSSGFSGGAPEFYAATGRSTSMPMNNPQSQLPYRSPLAGILPDQASHILNRRPDLIGKRSLAEFQLQQQLLQQQQQQQALQIHLRNVKPRTYQQASPISPLSPVEYSSVSPDISSVSSISSSSSGLNPRYGLPIHQQLRSQPPHHVDFNFASGVSLPDLLNHNRAGVGMSQQLVSSHESEKKMMKTLEELEKQLFDDEDEGDAVSAVTNSEWSETIQSLIVPVEKPSPSPTSSTSSCSSSADSTLIACPKQAIIEAANAVYEGKSEAALEILTRLSQLANARGTSKQRLTAYMTKALKSRVNPTEHPPPAAELHSKEHTVSTQTLYDISPCFKLGFMAANLAILDATLEPVVNKLHVVDFDVGQGKQYVHLLHALAGKKRIDKPIALKITTFSDFISGGEEVLKIVGNTLRAVANELGVRFSFNVMNSQITELDRERLGIAPDEALAVNFAFKLYKLPDESVSTENLRDELLRRVKALSPKVVTLVEQELNANTATFLARVNDACGYYGALFDSLDSTFPSEHPERVKVEEGMGRKIGNSVACEGRERVERCEVFGKWRARMTMAGFEPKPMSQLIADSLRDKLNSGTRGNPGFTVTEQSGGVCFGWMGRTLTVASAWR